MFISKILCDEIDKTGEEPKIVIILLIVAEVEFYHSPARISRY